MYSRLFCCLSLLFLAIPSAVADSSCLMCHGTQQEHAYHPPLENAGCQSCHGDSTAHRRSPRTEPPDAGFTGSDQSAARCLACHESSRLPHWSEGAHEMAGVDCHQCHTIHSQAPEAGEQCLDCHPRVKASLHLPSRHPLPEGKMQCTSCHDPHGSAGDSMLKGLLPTDNCIECHQELRAARLFEHQPVTEDCTLCHAPHGSAIDDMLKTRPPFLCQQCHMGVDHVSQMPNTNSLLQGSPGLLAGSCVNCHSQVHGSNHPSGARLTR